MWLLVDSVFWWYIIIVNPIGMQKMIKVKINGGLILNLLRQVYDQGLWWRGLHKPPRLFIFYPIKVFRNKACGYNVKLKICVPSNDLSCQIKNDFHLLMCTNAFSFSMHPFLSSHAHLVWPKAHLALMPLSHNLLSFTHCCLIVLF